jgi:Tol biopolymer transport system component
LPDGASVIYGADWEGVPHELYSQRLGALEARPLGMSNLWLTGVGPGELAVSEQGDDQATLSLVPFEGGGLRRIVDRASDADWSPDGRMAVSRAADGREWIEFPIGKTVWESTVGGVGGLRVSPDGKRVAFMEQPRAGDEDIAISVVDEAGRKTTLSPGWLCDWGSIAWSPDGEEVWFTARRVGSASSLHAVSLAGKERLVLSVGVDLKLSDIAKDGRVLLAEVERRTELRGAPDGIHERGFTWLDGTVLGGISSDGKRLLFSEVAEAGRGGFGTLYMRTLADPTPTRLGEGFPLGFSPDGAWALAFGETPEGRGRLSLVPTGVGDTRLLPRGNLQEITGGGWFPDGRRIVVAGNESGRPGRLFVQEVPDGAPRPLTPEGTMPLQVPASMVSPDGRLVVAAYTTGGAATPRYAFFPTAGGAALPIPGIGDDQPLCWSADGRFLYVQGGWLPLRIQRLDLRTGRKQLWKELRPPDPTGTDFHATVLGPDESAYFYGYERGLATLYVVDGLR